MKTEAYLSTDRRYRYWLTRTWDDGLPIMAVVGVNPSTADEQSDDPTIRKVIGFAQRLGYGGVLMLNVGAYRSTDPSVWKKSVDPFGPENTVDHLKSYLDRFKPEVVVAAWGKNCSKHRGAARALAIMKAIPELMCWGQNPDCTPRHPLMLPYSTSLIPYRHYFSVD